LDARLFAVQADGENLMTAALAELYAAQGLEGGLESVNQARRRAAELGVRLAEALQAERMARLESVPDALKAAAKLTQTRLFWVVPRVPNAGTQ